MSEAIKASGAQTKREAVEMGLTGARNHGAENDQYSDRRDASWIGSRCIHSDRDFAPFVEMGLHQCCGRSFRLGW
ncbi:hypothetical protein [Sphingobium xanthum]|uniref:hypothetical protein n=1 Tax=Sphingobium xanthum TaxID=1387165 RepID=UPI001C8CA435|nr:hypothetical protein [Sphingobium xanthum]